MKIKYINSRFVAFCKLSEKHLFLRGGWKWDADIKKWTTDDVTKVEPFIDACMPKAKATVQTHLDTVEEILAPSRAVTTARVYQAPDGLEYFPFQNAGIEFITSRPCTLLADQMGTGKTIQTVGAINERKARSVLIICPASLKGNWLKEFNLWNTQENMTVGIADGKNFPETNVVIINYENLKKQHQLVRARRWDFLAVDECHYIKNKKSARAKEIYGWGWGRKRIKEITATYKLWITGTPILNKPVDLWPIVEAFDPDGLGADWEDFVHTYCDAEETHFGLDTSGASNLKELQFKLRSTIMIRRLKKDVLKELPEKTRQVITLPKKGMVKIAREELAIFDQNMDMLESLNKNFVEEEKIDPIDAMAHITEKLGDTMLDKVEQIQADEGLMFESAALLRKDIALAKLPMCLEYINMLYEGGVGKLVVFAHHSEVIDGIMAVHGNHAVKIDGTVPVNKRQEQVDLFQNDPDVTMFVGNIAAASVGHTLTEASTVVFVELCYVPATMNQAEDRIHRIGQKNACNIIYLVLENSLEANMIHKLIEKEIIIEEAID